MEDTSSGVNFIRANNDGTTSNVELYHNGVSRLSTNIGGVNIVGTTTTGQLSVTGVSTFVGFATFTNNVHVGGGLTVAGDLTVTGDISYDEVTGRNLNITGVGTITRLNTTSLVGTSATITTLNSTTGTITQLTNTDFVSTSSTITSIVGTSATITRLNTTSLVGTSATISSGLYISGGELTVGAAFTVSQAGVVTATKFVGEVDSTTGNYSGVGTFSTLHVGTSGTVLAAVDSATISLGSGANPVTATLNGGSIPSIGLAIALGG